MTMGNREHLKILEGGVSAWNNWREEHPDTRPDLGEAVLEGRTLVGINLSRAKLSHATLSRSDLRHANLSHSDLFCAELVSANMREANLRGAALVGARFRGALLAGADIRDSNGFDVDFSVAELLQADLSNAALCSAKFTGAQLRGTNFTHAVLGGNVFANNDLSQTKGLDTVRHDYASAIGIDTLYRSRGRIPESFLRGAGVPDILIQYLPSLVSAEQVIQYYSCFISHSTQDNEFAQRLHSRLQQEHVRVWFAPEDMRGGDKVHEQVDEAIRVYDKLLLVLSENSMSSEWVKREIRKARKQEITEKRRKLFPIRLVSYDKLAGWECQDSFSGQDLAEEVRQYFVPDFSNWKKHDAFAKAFKRLLRDLQPKATTGAK